MYTLQTLLRNMPNVITRLETIRTGLVETRLSEIFNPLELSITAWVHILNSSLSMTIRTNKDECVISKSSFFHCISAHFIFIWFPSTKFHPLIQEEHLRSALVALVSRRELGRVTVTIRGIRDWGARSTDTALRYQTQLSNFKPERVDFLYKTTRGYN